MLNNLSTEYIPIDIDDSETGNENNKIFICAEDWVWVTSNFHSIDSGELHGLSGTSGTCVVAGCTFGTSAWVLQSISCTSTGGGPNSGYNGPTNTPNEGPNGYGTGSNPFVSAPNYTQPWENVQKCMNGFGQPNTADNTVMDLIMIDWLKANKHKAGKIQNFLGESGCSEEAQEIMLDVTSIMITNPDMDFEEAILQYLEINPDAYAIEGPDITITNMTEYLNCLDTSSSALNANITLYVDEPTENSNNVFGVDGVGHAFISIQQGSNIVSFGFYPQYSIPSFFTPVIGVMGDNSNTTYDVSLSIANISPEVLQTIIDHAIAYSNSDYNLNGNNCTDMAISMANLLGLPIPECNANPLVFFGSTPGRLGQHIRNMNLPSGTTMDNSGGISPNNNCN